jgi:hypothetical protein
VHSDSYVRPPVVMATHAMSGYVVQRAPDRIGWLMGTGRILRDSG